MNFFGANYKKYLVIPLVLFILFGFLSFVYPGLTQGIDLKGGSFLIIRFEKQISQEELEQFLEENFDLVDLQVQSISSPLGHGVRIQFAESKSIGEIESLVKQASSAFPSNPELSKQYSLQALELISSIIPVSYSAGDSAENLLAIASDNFPKAKENFNESLQEQVRVRFELGEQVALQKSDVAPILGELFWQGALWVGLLSVIFVVLVIFFFFREIIPSVAILLAAAFDILASLTAMAVFSIPLSLATIPTLLLLIGYSIDTDILLTTRVLKRRDLGPRERSSEAMKTGLTMTGTTIVAVLVMLVLSFFTQLEVVFTIAFLLFFGLLADLISTWLMNAPLLLWYVERKQKKQGVVS